MDVQIVDIYCRSAAEDGNTLDAQEAACREFAAANGLTVGMVFKEITSGFTIQRAKLERLRQRYEEINGIIILRLTCLSRNTVDLLTLQQEMVEHNVTLYCV